MTQRPHILHITSDFPDLISRDKPMAVHNLVHSCKQFNHTVFSLNRSTLPLRPRFLTLEPGYAVQYWGLPWGIGLKNFQHTLARSILTRIERDHIRFDVIHAHKLTFEGVTAFYLSDKLKKPFVCSIRGSTDIRTMKYKPLYRQFYLEILRKSSILFFVSPWVRKVIQKRYSISVLSDAILPNIVSEAALESAIEQGQLRHSNRFVSIFRLDSYKGKNIEKLIRAFDLAIDHLGDLHLDIFGGGTDKSICRMKKIIRSAKHPSRIHMLGKLSNAEVCKLLPHYAALLLPSYPETFGMVYIEALFAGIPFMHAKETGIDGYFLGRPFCVGVNHKSIIEILLSIKDLWRNQITYKEQIIEFKRSGAMDIFSSETIITDYVRRIHQALDDFQRLH